MLLKKVSLNGLAVRAQAQPICPSQSMVSRCMGKFQTALRKPAYTTCRWVKDSLTIARMFPRIKLVWSHVELDGLEILRHTLVAVIVC